MNSGSAGGAAGGVGARKHTLREEMRRKLRAVSPEEIAEASSAIAKRLEALPEFARARSVHTFLSMAGEVDTSPLLDLCQASGKTVFVPAMVSGGTEMAVAFWNAGCELVRGPLGILQPNADVLPPGKLDRIDLVLVPGLAFDSRGARLGRGKGHYDKFLAELRRQRIEGEAAQASGAPPLRVLAVALDLQIIGVDPQSGEGVPVESHDMALDGILTESRFVRLTGSTQLDPPGEN